ncbi:hypothetical protein DSO57_1025866 [Entomophthora muscae]|nr:hypothetical protein DSO57_1025866 [Entomophthora muscae]
MKRSRDKESEYQDETSKGSSRLTMWIFLPVGFYNRYWVLASYPSSSLFRQQKSCLRARHSFPRVL